MTLSVLIPAYNEEQRLAPTLQRIVSYFDGRGEEIELLVIDDGSRDATVAVAEQFGEPVRVLRLERNRGKGAALRMGVLASTGDTLLLTDADLSTPIEEFALLEPHLARYEMVIGSRGLATSNITESQPFYRVFMGKTFNRIIRLLGVRGFRDTQCGFKLLRGEIGRELFSYTTIDRFAYDVELIWLARRFGYSVAEIGVTWAHTPESRVHPVRDSLRMLHDVVRFRWRHLGVTPRAGEREGDSG
jgi:dolichyl-phosphate beta-glucosyltransferase